MCNGARESVRKKKRERKKRERKKEERERKKEEREKERRERERERKERERKKEEKERRERERKEEKERKEEEKERNRSIFQSRSKRRRLRFLLEVIDVGRIALKNAIKISDEGTERRLMDRLSKFIQVDRLVEIENLQIGLRFFRGGVICKAFVIIYWDSYQFSSQYQVISCR